jgi:flagellar hook-basal body complex protein FliE
LDTCAVPVPPEFQYQATGAQDSFIFTNQYKENTMTPQEACDKATLTFAEAELALNRAARKLNRLQRDLQEVEAAFADDDDKDLHSNRFSEMHAEVARAIGRVGTARHNVTKAHREGQCICDDGGVIVAGGGGGK